MLRPRAIRWTHDMRDKETNLIKQLNPMSVRRLHDSKEFRAIHGAASGDPQLLLAEASDNRYYGRHWQPWERLLVNGKMLVDSVEKSWPNMDTDLAEARFGHDWLMGCGTSNALTTQILRDPLNLTGRTSPRASTSRPSSKTSRGRPRSPTGRSS